MKYKVTGSLGNRYPDNQILIDANGNIELAAAESLMALQILGSAASAISVSGSIEKQNYEVIYTANVNDSINLFDCEKYNELIINIDNHTGNTYTLYVKHL